MNSEKEKEEELKSPLYERITPSYLDHKSMNPFEKSQFHTTGAAEGIQDWSDHLKRTSIRKSSIRPEL